jgi:hypothetical protein
MNAHKLRAVMSQDGQLLLDGLPFRAGDMVEVIVMAQTTMSSSAEEIMDYPLPVMIDAGDRIYLASISNVMEEWESASDEAAYLNL